MSLPPDQIDLLKELINIGTGRAAAALSELAGARIVLQVPQLEVIDTAHDMGSVGEMYERRMASVRQVFSGALGGSALLLFPPQSGVELVRLLTDIDPEEEDFSGEYEGTLCEVGNIVLNGVLGSLGNILERELHFQVPEFEESTVQDIFHAGAQGDGASSASHILFARAFFHVEGRSIEGVVAILFALDSLQVLVEHCKAA